MICEYRTYTVAPGRLPELHERFRKHTLALFERHRIAPIAFFTPEIGGPSDSLTYLLAFDSLAQRETAWKGFHADPEWQAVKAASDRDGPLVLRLTNVVFKPTDYSPLA